MGRKKSLLNNTYINLFESDIENSNEIPQLFQLGRIFLKGCSPVELDSASSDRAKLIFFEICS